jgi:hypothetical protein
MTKLVSAIFISILAMAAVFSSCVKQNTPTIDINEMPDTTAIQVNIGTFSNGPFGSVGGSAKIFSSSSGFELKLMDFRSNNGPDLRVYLSKEMQPVNYIDLGALKSTTGNQVYTIPGNPDFGQYKYALVHCRQFNHLFGWALLQ